MAEHPSLPMRNGLYRSQAVGKTGSSPWHQLTFNLYHDSSTDTSMMYDDGNWEVQIFEVNNTTDNNWVRTVYDFTSTITTSDYTSSSIGLINSQTINLNLDSNTAYAIRGSYDDNFSSVNTSTHDSGNYYNVSQAAALSDFDSSSETDVVVDSLASLGTGFPTAREGSEIMYPITFRPVLNSNGIWLFMYIS